MIFVVDSTDRQRIEDTNGCGNSGSDHLHRILQDDVMKDVAVLIMANKQDLPNAMSVDEVQDKLQMTQWTIHSPELLMSLREETFLKLLPESIINILSEYTPHRQCGPVRNGGNGTQTKCFIVGTCATTGDGLYEGLDCLSQTLNQTIKKNDSACIVM